MGAIFAHKVSESAAASVADCGESIGAFVQGAAPMEFSGKKSDEPEKSSGAAATHVSPTAGWMGSSGSLVESENVADMLL